ncbi:hypothetical protein Dimus_030685 [Dionaea muscipula]
MKQQDEKNIRFPNSPLENRKSNKTLENRICKPSSRYEDIKILNKNLGTKWKKHKKWKMSETLNTFFTEEQNQRKRNKKNYTRPRTKSKKRNKIKKELFMLKVLSQAKEEQKNL